MAFLEREVLETPPSSIAPDTIKASEGKSMSEQRKDMGAEVLVVDGEGGEGEGIRVVEVQA